MGRVSKISPLGDVSHRLLLLSARPTGTFPVTVHTNRNRHKIDQNIWHVGVNNLSKMVPVQELNPQSLDCKTILCGLCQLMMTLGAFSNSFGAIRRVLLLPYCSFISSLCFALHSCLPERFCLVDLWSSTMKAHALQLRDGWNSRHVHFIWRAISLSYVIWFLLLLCTCKEVTVRSS